MKKPRKPIIIETESEQPEPEAVIANEPGASEPVTWPVPAILFDPDHPERSITDTEITHIAVYRRLDPMGTFSWLQNVTPGDLANEEMLLSAFGVGMYKLVGKDNNNQVRRQRFLAVGDFGPKPMVHQAHPPPPPSGKVVESLATIVAPVLGFFTTLLQTQQESSRTQLQMFQAQSAETFKILTQAMGARTGDLEQLLRQALEAKRTAGPSQGIPQSMIEDLLAAQGGIYEALLDGLKDAGGNDGILEGLLQALVLGAQHAKEDQSAPTGG